MNWTVLETKLNHLPVIFCISECLLIYIPFHFVWTKCFIERQIFPPEPKGTSCAHNFINRFTEGESAARSNHADKIMWLQADIDTNTANMRENAAIMAKFNSFFIVPPREIWFVIGLKNRNTRNIHETWTKTRTAVTVCNIYLFV